MKVQSFGFEVCKHVLHVVKALPFHCLGSLLGVCTLTLWLSDMEFLDVLTEGLERVLMVRGGGREVITIYS